MNNIYVWDLAEWLERLTVNGVLGSIPASSDTVESEGRQMKQCQITYHIKTKIQKKTFKFLWLSTVFGKVSVHGMRKRGTSRPEEPGGGGGAPGPHQEGSLLTPQSHNWHLSPSADTSAPQLTPQPHSWHLSPTADTSSSQLTPQSPKTDTSAPQLTPQPHNWHLSPTTDTSAPQLTPHPHNWHLSPTTDT